MLGGYIQFVVASKTACNIQTPLLQYYAMERFLHRLSVSSFAYRFILKGALLLRVWQAPLARPTMDIDMLGRAANAPEKITTIIHQVLAVEE